MSENPWRTEKVRRTRAEVQPIADRLEAEIRELNPGLEFHFGGSWARGADSIGDIDTLFITADGTLAGVVLPPSVVLQRDGDKVAQGDMEVGGVVMHVDFWAATPAQRGGFMWFITGPKELNIAMRVEALKAGKSLSQYGLMNMDGEQLDNGTEADIARLLGQKWVALLNPLTRNGWASPQGRTSVTLVPSFTGGSQIYSVFRSGTYYRCSCPAYKFRGECKHIESLKV